MSLHELKPCPFCGGEAGLSSVGTSYMAHCYTPNCIMEVTPYFASIENAVDAWNKRTDEGKTAAGEKRKGTESAFNDLNWKWLLPLLLFPFTEPPRREISINAQINGKSVNITYDPHDPEAVKAAEVWRKALFAVKDEDSVKFGEQQCRDYLKGAVERYLQNKQKHVDQAIAAMEAWTPRKSMTELEKASEPLRAYLKKHGDPHTSVTVTQYGATETQDERRVTFDGEKAAETVKNGRWEKSNILCEEYVCSECGGACWYYGYNGKLSKSRYCPNCGARMEDVT